MCEKLCRTLLKQLTESEDSFKETNERWKTKMAKWEEWRRNQEKSQKAFQNKSKKGASRQDEEKASKLDLQRDAGEVEASQMASFDPTAPIEGFYFADWTKLLPSEFERYRRQLERRGVPMDLLDALQRGIGVHHAGMNRKYRQVYVGFPTLVLLFC